ncbi:hypothetical protein MKZ38_006608 [Zalerion maritima]|uniref:non-specific serine/threonine protein kinase n=1 Tax=Zalerion maritima TaxID=339359 RepID=A0AAD5RJX2_9PEZI|nr:hypothetical protein MKZ38_006608 [Zalerion maritima]
MAPPPAGSSASSGDRQYQNGRSAVPARVERSGTPRKNSGNSRDRAVQDPGLKDYEPLLFSKLLLIDACTCLERAWQWANVAIDYIWANLWLCACERQRTGECLGKGAFGSVYKAFNWNTGEAVAIKQVKVADLPKSELRMIEHDNIVKYIGFVKTSECLNIILEYCENGSLHSICKSYGKFPENLVGVYMTQVLQGLQYLHDQGVIHRDIKGANILTTKDGTVKLADFGVSTNTLAGPDKEAQVVGTPYWMAPEIIQLFGATSASDIWSVGCTVIELLQGRPPYHQLAAMPALFAIVNDDHPPLPEGVSPAARDFLMQCFQKDPNLRVSARKLLRHPWIVGCRKSEAPASKAPSNFNRAVEEVKQWNKALKSSETSLRASMGSDGQAASFLGPSSRMAPVESHRSSAVNPSRPSALARSSKHQAVEAFSSLELGDDDDNWENDFETAISPTALQLPQIKPQDNFGGLFAPDRLKAYAESHRSGNDSGTWDDNSQDDLLTIKPQRKISNVDLFEETIRPPSLKRHSRNDSRSQQQAELRKTYASGNAPSKQPKSPSKPTFGAKFELPPRPDMIYREQTIEDYSDLFTEDDSVFNRRLGNLPVKTEAPQLFHPSDLTSLPRSTQSPLQGSLRGSGKGRPASLPKRTMQRTDSNISIEQFAEDKDDEDFSDIFGPDEVLTEKDESDRGSEDGGGLMLLSKVSNKSWLGDDEDEDDPFASMDPGWDEMDLEANIARDRHARLCESVEARVRSLKSSEGEERLSEISEDLLKLLLENEEVKALIISNHGLLPILEILETCDFKSRQMTILQFLQVVNVIIQDDVELQENLCFVGGIPIITKFSGLKYSNDIRLEAAFFVRQMYTTSTLTLQMFVSAGGLNVLVEFLEEDYETSKDLVLIGVNGIWNVFELQGPTPKNDFCRIFSRSKILDPLALVLHSVLDEDEKDSLTEAIEGRIVNIFYLFSQAENYVKESVADRQVLKNVMKDLRRMSPQHQITMLKFIKNLSMLSTTLEALHSADAIEFLTDLLSYYMKKGHNLFREVSNQVLNTMFNLCRLSKERQEDAAVNGIIPLLMKIMKTDRPPKEFALPILCDMAHSGSKGRRYLWQNKGLDFYITLLSDQYWQVSALDAIFVWLQEETAKIEAQLMQGKFTEAIVSAFNNTSLNNFDANLLEPLLKLLRLSPSISASLAKENMYSGIVQKLPHKKAVVRLNLLRLVRTIMDAREAEGSYLPMSKNTQLRILFDAIQTLAEKDTAVLVRNLASELTKMQVEADADAGSISSASSQGNGRRSRSGPRRNTYAATPPALQTAFTAPSFPSHSRLSSHSAGTAYIEVAASPRRSGALQFGHEREGGLAHRPHSRDGGGTSSLPRRVSGDASAAGSPLAAANGASGSYGVASGGVKSRLPRHSTAYKRSSLSRESSHQQPLVMTRADRADSSLSNKENFGGRRERGSSGGDLRYDSGAARHTPGQSSVGSTSSATSVTTATGGKRRSRAPSSDMKWQ